MPIQAGDDRLLKAMHRGYTVERYEELAAQIRARVPGISITSDSIVGFPGETEEMFEHTLDTFRRIRFDQQFLFVYSPRPGTPAATLEDQAPHEVKVARMNRLVELQNNISIEVNAEKRGAIFEVMMEGPSDRDPNKLTGRARNNKTLVFPTPAENPPQAGDIVRVRAETAHLWGCTGELIFTMKQSC